MHTLKQETHLLEIVPTGSELIVETQIDPKDIADIVQGKRLKYL